MNELEFLQNLVADLRAENSALLEIIFKSKGLAVEDQETETTVQVTPQQAVGRRLPWYLRKAKLEHAFAKPRLSTITGIPDSDASASEEEIA